MLLVGPVSLARAQAPAAAPAYELREKGITVRVDGADATQWEDVEELLKDQLQISTDVSPTEPLADDLAFFTRQFYIRAGWPRTEVRWELRGGLISLSISTGPQVRVGDITWRGDVFLPTEELRQFLLRSSLEKDGADQEHPLWVDGELADGVGFVQRRLRAEGYLQAAVKMDLAPPLPEGGYRDITATIMAGPKFVYGEILFFGAPPEIEVAMRAEIKQNPGAPFSEGSVQQVERRLVSIARQNSYLQAQVTSDYTLGKVGGSVDVTLRVDPGPRVRIARVTPHPDFSRGSRRVLEAVFKSTAGDFYSPTELDIHFRRVLDTGIFARLDMTPVILDQAQDGIAHAELRLTGEETKPESLGFEVGFDTFLGALVGVTYRNVNFRDTGNSLSAELRYSPFGPLGSVEIRDPAILNSQFAATAQLRIDNFQRYEYTRYGAGVNLELSRRVSVPFSYTLFAAASANTVSSDMLTERDLGPTDYTLTSIGASMRLDYRDSPVLPTRGWYVNARIESTTDAMGSGVSFLRTDLRGGWHHSFNDKLRLAVGAAHMSIQGADVDAVPIDARVFNGGPNTVRSFPERELGPNTPGGTPLGGTAAFVGSAELSYELINNLDFAIFTDVGNLSRRNDTSPYQYATGLKVAVGAGLRYRLPFGPLRIDYGYNANREPFEPRGTLHITLGFAF